MKTWVLFSLSFQFFLFVLALKLYQLKLLFNGLFIQNYHLFQYIKFCLNSILLIWRNMLNIDFLNFSVVHVVEITWPWRSALVLISFFIEIVQILKWLFVATSWFSIWFSFGWHFLMGSKIIMIYFFISI